MLMKTNENSLNRIEFTRGNSNAPLPGIRSADLHPNKEDNKKGTSKDISELKRKRLAAENEAKRLKIREGKK
jgi:IS4 transposase